MKLREHLNSPIKNILYLLLGTIIAVIIGFSANLPQSSNHGGLIPLIYPPIIAMGVIIIYLLSRIFTKKYNWIITMLAIVYMIMEAIVFYINNDIS